jgi:hypothetical protein
LLTFNEILCAKECLWRTIPRSICLSPSNRRRAWPHLGIHPDSLHTRKIVSKAYLEYPHQTGDVSHRAQVYQTLADFPNEREVVFGIFVCLFPFLIPQGIVQFRSSVTPFCIGLRGFELASEFAFPPLTHGWLSSREVGQLWHRL